MNSSRVNGQGIDGNPSLQIAPGDTSCIRATVIDPIAAGASWTVVPVIQRQRTLDTTDL